MAQTRFMDRAELRRFILEWVCYLEQRGQRVKRVRGALDTLLSRSGRAGRYRWLLLHVAGSTRRLTPIERENIARENRLGHKTGEQVYVAIKFSGPVDRVVVLSAENAARSPCLRADTGGIPWDW